MGIWESLQWMAEAGRRGLADPAAAAIGCAGRAAMAGAGWAAGAAAGAATAIIGTGRAAGGAIGGAGQAVGAAIGGTVAEKVGAGASEGARRMKEAMPDREGWGRISRIAWRITDHALTEFSRAYTFGIPVYRYIKEGFAKDGADSKEKKDRKQEAAGKEEEADNLEKKDQKPEAAGAIKTKEENQGGSRKARGRL